jgi:hypothetical protein
MRKGELKKEGKHVPMRIRLSKRARALIERNAKLTVGGNIAAWMTLRSITRNDREFQAELKRWKHEQEELWTRRLKRRGLLDDPRKKGA